MVAAPTDPARDAELLRGVLDLAVLAAVAREPAHAYALVERLEAHGFGDLSYGSIYPLTARLRRLGLLQVDREASPVGPARHLLRPTAEGLRALATWRGGWERVTGATASVLDDLDRARSIGVTGVTGATGAAAAPDGRAHDG